MAARRVYAIGDIHGQYDHLVNLILSLRFTEDLDLDQDKLIFMGDYIDRGPRSKEVVEFIMGLTQKHPNNVVALKGNHEDMCVRSHSQNLMEAIEWKGTWLYPGNGGRDTMASYGGEIPEEHLKWMKALPVQHREPGYFFSHAPCVSADPEHLSDDDLMWGYARPEAGGARVIPQKDNRFVIGVCGHQVGKSEMGIYKMRFYTHYIFTDAACGKTDGGRLGCVELQSLNCWYASSKDVRKTFAYDQGFGEEVWEKDVESQKDGLPVSP